MSTADKVNNVLLTFLTTSTKHTTANNDNQLTASCDVEGAGLVLVPISDCPAKELEAGAPDSPNENSLSSSDPTTRFLEYLCEAMT
jgi:hypothetical protein